MLSKRYALQKNPERCEFHRDTEVREVDPSTYRAKKRKAGKNNKRGLRIPAESWVDGLFSVGGERGGGVSLGQRDATHVDEQGVSAFRNHRLPANVDMAEEAGNSVQNVLEEGQVQPHLVGAAPVLPGEIH
jgi:hypothetical protein